MKKIDNNKFQKLTSFFLNSEADFLSFLVSVGKSKKTRTHIILYSLNLLYITFPDKQFFSTHRQNSAPVKQQSAAQQPLMDFYGY